MRLAVGSPPFALRGSGRFCVLARQRWTTLWTGCCPGRPMTNRVSSGGGGATAYVEGTGTDALAHADMVRAVDTGMLGTEPALRESRGAVGTGLEGMEVEAAIYTSRHPVRSDMVQGVKLYYLSNRWLHRTPEIAM